MPASGPIDALDRIAQSDDAVFALDAHFLVILWNRGCERLLGRPAYQALGHRCYDVLCGRDVYGNRYCGPSCPVAAQAHFHPDEPLQPFLADVPAAGGTIKRLKVSTFAIPAKTPSHSTLVHVLRDPARASSSLERDLGKTTTDGSPPDRRRRPRRALPALTLRERETLRRLSQGHSTGRIAREMRISQVTVRNHVARILTKLGVHTKLGAVAFAYRSGLIRPELSPLSARPRPRRYTRRA